jgi:hypothetical protein
MMRNDSDRHLVKRGGQIFYIYTHARPDGSVFYVGKGIGRRARDFRARSDQHKAITGELGLKNIVVRAYPVPDERHALTAERVLILALRKAGARLVNADNGGGGFSGGRVKTPEHRKKLSQAGMGHAVSDETRKKIGERGRGRRPTEATRAKLSAKKLSESHKAALLAAISGRIVSEESRAKSRAKMQGRTLTADHRQKLSDSHKGLKHDPSTKATRSAALKAAWARRKAEVANAQ